MTNLNRGNTYRGYTIIAAWVEEATSKGELILPGHWVFRIFQGGDWVDTFLTPDLAKEQIDLWHDAP